MFRFIFFVFTILCFIKSASAVILVIPDEKDWNESERRSLFQTIEEYSILSGGLTPEIARSYVESNLTEKEFIQESISKKFPKKSLRIKDVPATLVDIATLHENFFTLYEREDDNLNDFLPTNQWSENTRMHIYFAISAMVLSTVDQEKSYEDALKVLFEGIAKKFQEDSSFVRLKNDLDSSVSLLKEGLEQEENALKSDSFVWFRGSKGEKVNDTEQVLNFPIDLSELSKSTKLTDFHTLSPEEQFKSMQSFSFGVSLLAGFAADSRACTYSYAIGGRHCYALQIPKKYFFTEPGNKLWLMPNVNPVLQVISGGERFHPRSIGRKVDGHSRFLFDPTLDYKKLALAMSNLLLNNTILIQYNCEIVTENSHGEIKKDLHTAYQKLHDALSSEKQ